MVRAFHHDRCRWADATVVSRWREMRRPPKIKFTPMKEATAAPPAAATQT